ncbi:MAG: RNA 2'-phosphotransferase [Deltaproteobacteria bacterium]|nr:RNA 2'-phosphotransferase [Deltaproteobacteria bacterium]
MNRKLVRISKFLSLVLRHKPERIGLSLDRGGWAKIDELLLKANQAGLSLHKDLLQRVVDSNDKHRFSFSQDRQGIRANYGHSIPVDLDFAPSKPPEFLFHGTATRFVESIREQGLVPRKRNHVHLSPDHQTAIMVGRRHGKPIVLTIQAGRMYEFGFQFFCSTNGVWLTEKVPAEHLLFPEE